MSNAPQGFNIQGILNNVMDTMAKSALTNDCHQTSHRMKVNRSPSKYPTLVLNDSNSINREQSKWQWHMKFSHLNVHSFLEVSIIKITEIYSQGSKYEVSITMCTSCNWLLRVLYARNRGIRSDSDKEVRHRNFLWGVFATPPLCHPDARASFRDRQCQQIEGNGWNFGKSCTSF